MTNQNKIVEIGDYSIDRSLINQSELARRSLLSRVYINKMLHKKRTNAKSIKNLINAIKKNYPTAISRKKAA